MILEEKIFSINSESEFEKIALEVFRFQAENNLVYAEYLKCLNKSVADITDISQIPFLPIEFFKSKKVVSGIKLSQQIFTSSGTTGNTTSRHFVPDLELYEKSFLLGFQQYYDLVEDYCILALLPSYLERKGSSLIYMMEKMIEKSNNPSSGFYLHNHDELIETIKKEKKAGSKILLLGVSFALLDLAEKYKLDFSDVIVMETGGMKGRRKEITREELHAFLCDRFNVKEIHSEYGMTELLSQGYSKGKSLFNTPSWMKVVIRDTYDPFSYEKAGRTGGVNIIDLANLYSCSFLETQDLGRIHKCGSFEILGRFDNSDLRGCNMLITE